MAQYHYKLFPLLLLAFVAINQGNKDQEMKSHSTPMPTTPSVGTRLIGNATHVRSPTGLCRYPGETFADTENCSVYYICYGSYEDPEIYLCPAGTYYNPYAGVCHADYLCPVIPAVCTENGVFPHPENCASFFFCSDIGIAPMFGTCSPPLFFNPNIQVCDNWQNVNCRTRPGCSDSHMFFPDFYDCTKYYYCTSNLDPMKYSCKIYEFWDYDTDQCVPSCQANCAIP